MADGGTVLEYSSVVCGDEERFEVKVIQPEKPDKLFSDCTAFASLSPNRKWAMLEGDLVDMDLWAI